MTEHWFWWLLSMACVIWYSTITVYVSVKGVFDIREMLRDLSTEGAASDGGTGAGSGVSRKAGE
jgi:hypothetical protein